MTTLARARAFALALPEVTEEDHHGLPSFRIAGKIFATVPDDAHLRIMVDEHQIRAAVAEHPSACAELYWGKRLSCVVVELSKAAGRLVEGLLSDAWERKAPARLGRREG
jgi:hypothetical protein